jgi:hypothetical protein
MITSKRIKQKFEDYRKWFFTFLAKEFINLPLKSQDRLLIIVKKFVENCERVYEEAKNIKEKSFIINVKEIETRRRGIKANACVMIGNVLEINKEIRISLPLTQAPGVGDNIECILFSLDEESWYSSKEALITAGR